MSDTHDGELLAEITDDLNDLDTDFGRGYRAGWKAAAGRIADGCEVLEQAQRRKGLWLAALSYGGAASLARLVHDERDDDGEPSDAA